MIGIGGTRDNASNGILMPDSEAKAKAIGKKVYHNGSHRDYYDLVAEKLK